MAKTYPVRVRATGLIIEDGRVLLVQWQDADEIGYNLPGGGVQEGETIRAAVQREVREETTAEAEVGPLAFMYEYEPTRDGKRYGGIHMIALVFACTLRTRPAVPEVGDDYQIGIKWVPLDDLHQVNLVPRIAGVIRDYARTGRAVTTFIEEWDLRRLY